MKILNRISAFLSRNVLLRICKQTILPIFDYGRIVWGDCGKQNEQRLELLQNQTIRIILAAHRKSCTQNMRTRLNKIFNLLIRTEYLVNNYINIDLLGMLLCYGLFTRREGLPCATVTRSKRVKDSPGL